MYLRKRKMLYDLIYCDPPWKYNDKSLNKGGALRHYKCLTLQKLSEISIPARSNSIILMWATYPLLPTALQLMNNWNFIYKTVAFTWVKSNLDNSLYMGMGHYTRANAEICLLGKRGKGLKRKVNNIRNTQIITKTRHSRKPHKFRKDIELLFGDVDKLEMFARHEYPGWDVYGDQVQNSIKL